LGSSLAGGGGPAGSGGGVCHLPRFVAAFTTAGTSSATGFFRLGGRL
jgi:hypothetical protein